MRILILIALLALVPRSITKKAKDGEKPEWAKKDIRDFTDADLERLLDQWEEDEDPLEPDELPEHLRPQPRIDLSNLDSTNPEELLKASKKGRTLMTFVSVGGKPTREEADTITKLWQTSLWNNHIQAERYMVDDDRAIFLFKDGSQAWDAKDFLVKQPRCKGVTIENKEYPGAWSSEHSNEKQEL
ncbi:LDLR chaperone boca [Rhagoletis pomonella]|uniref:LDLR chaperone boca n=1 Tax=Rhagoletis pomonella TaxID=28610 RepID=UPI00177FD373|nr:LDLR chaperone boca [Rhagoletis pomonella]